MPSAEFWMKRALELARRGFYTAHPNPRVGCVIVKNNHVIAEGFHLQAGAPHAEAMALSNLKESAEGADVFVTLEPCAHFGRTPPCAEALVRAKVKKVFIATLDSNPLVAGRGVQILKNAGIDVAVGILESDARALNDGFLKRFEIGRAFIRIKTAASLDGKTALLNGKSKWLTSDAARLDAMRYRASASAILTGISTVLADNPQMNVRQNFGKTQKIRQPIVFVMDSFYRTPLESPILKNEKVVIIGNAPDSDALLKRQNLLKNHAEILEVANTQNLKSVVEKITVDFALNEIHVEAGKTLNGAFLKAGLVDELVLYVAPVVLGEKARSLFALAELTDLSQKLCFQIAAIKPLPPDFCVVATFCG